MDLFEEPQYALPRNVNLEQDVIPTPSSPSRSLIRQLEVDIIKTPVNNSRLSAAASLPTHGHVAMDAPQSIWGYRLRQNIRARLLRRGVSMELIDSTKDPPQEGETLPQDEDVLLPEDNDLNMVETGEGISHWAQDMGVWPRMLLQTINSHKPGICKLCARIMTNITKHHLHPKVGRGRRPPLGMGWVLDLNTTIDLCRPCHSMIHHIFPNTLMSDSYYSLPLLESHPRVQAWVSWARRQRIHSSWPLVQPRPPPILCSKKKLNADKVKKRAERIKRKKEKKKFNVAKLQNALAQLWHDSGSEIPRSFSNLPALRQELSDLVDGDNIRIANLKTAMRRNADYHEWHQCIFPGVADSASDDKLMLRTKLKAALIKEMRTTGVLAPKIKEALDRIWRETGNDFPRFPGDLHNRGRALRQAVRACLKTAEDPVMFPKFHVKELRKSMQLDAKYRTWFEWTFRGALWVAGGVQASIRSGTLNKEEHGGRDGKDHGGLVTQTHPTGTGTGSKANPIVFDLTDGEDEEDSLGRQGSATVSLSGRVVIDLTMDDADMVEDDQRP